MARVAKKDRSVRNVTLIKAITKYLADRPALRLAGRSITPAELVAILQRQVDLIQRSRALLAERMATVRSEEAIERDLAELLQGLRATVTQGYGRSALVVLTAFGYAPTKRRRPTAATKAAAVKKSGATRRARGTMGKRQRQRIKG